MTVRTRKTITDLIQQLKVQEKEIKSQLSDDQRRLNETRDRIATCYWVIEETFPNNDPCESCELCDLPIPYTLAEEEFKELQDKYPELSSTELASTELAEILFNLGCEIPMPEKAEKKKIPVKSKPKAKPLPKKKPTKKGKK